MNNIKHIPFTIEGRDYIADILDRDGSDMIAIRPICKAIGIAENKQIMKLKNNPQFNCDHMVSVAGDRKERQMFCISIDQVATWLTAINSAKVKADARDILLQFQQHCQRELYAAVTGRAGVGRVEELEKKVNVLEDQMSILTHAMKIQNSIVEDQREQIKSLQAAQADADQTEAEMAGKYLARAKKTKHLRSIH